MMVWLASGLLLGLIGGLHCLGMCGPLIFAFSGNTRIEILAYHLGRILMYACLRLIAGTIGMSLELGGIQQSVTLISSILMLALIWIPFPKNRRGFAWLSYGMQKFSQNNSASSKMALGALNGLLPCGSVYIAMAGSAGGANPVYSALFMAMFGLGTFPVLAMVSFVGKQVSPIILVKLRGFVPYLASFIACLMIIRGMNLGIPYLSPQQTKSGNLSCCKIQPTRSPKH
ncbi:MAG: sulfite exporter TauE/SafE family protein [Sphingobacteriia bacterium]|nr:sulfite exporter TauE/SafE family protein [Sphingobacteriia bacterium]